MALAVCSRNVKFYEYPSMTLVETYEIPKDRISAKHVSWNCDGTDLLVIKNKDEPEVLGTTRERSKYSIEPRQRLPIANVFSGVYSKSDPNILALGLENGEVTLVNVEQMLFNRYKKLPAGIQNIDISPKDEVVLAGCFDGTIFLYDSERKPSASFRIPNASALSAALLSDFSNLMAAGGKDGSLAIWNTETADMDFFAELHSARITNMVFLENSLTSVSTDGYLCLLDLRTYNLTSKTNLEGALSSLAYFSTNDLVIGTYNQLRKYDLRNLSTPTGIFLINDGSNIKNICASPQRNEPQILEEATPSCSEDFSALEEDFIDPSPRLDKQPSVKELEVFVKEYLKHCSAKFEEKIAQSFYALKISTSKQFICMEEKMESSWKNFVNYLRLAGNVNEDCNEESGSSSKNEVTKSKSSTPPSSSSTSSKN